MPHPPASTRWALVSLIVGSGTANAQDAGLALAVLVFPEVMDGWGIAKVHVASPALTAWSSATLALVSVG